MADETIRATLEDVKKAKEELEKARKLLEMAEEAGLDVSEQRRRYEEVKAQVEALERAASRRLGS